MCSGHITRYGCGHEDRVYYYLCPDGANQHYQELLPHRLVGRRFRSTQLCRDCEEDRRCEEEEVESEDRQTDEERAKSLLEYFRGERAWPRPDDEVSERFERAYGAGERLHPWFNCGEEPALNAHRALIVRSFTSAIDPSSTGEEGTRLFQTMLDRQADMDRTGRPITDADRDFSLSRIIERGAQFADQIREQVRQELAGERIIEYMRANERQADDLSQTIRHVVLDSDQIMGETTETEQALQQQEAPQIEQPAGLYESDPEWLLNFNDWCYANSPRIVFRTEADLRGDINGWFQHLRSCESQPRLDWIAFAESFRDAIQAGDMCHYEYSPLDAAEGEGPSSFRHWCIANADPAEIRVSSMNSVFINLLQGYTAYLSTNGWLEDLEAFQSERGTRITVMHQALAQIPGAPLTPSNLSIIYSRPLYGETASVSQMHEDIDRLCREGSCTTALEVLERQGYIARLYRLQDEAREVREARESSSAPFIFGSREMEMEMEMEMEESESEAESEAESEQDRTIDNVRRRLDMEAFERAVLRELRRAVRRRRSRVAARFLAIRNRRESF